MRVVVNLSQRLAAAARGAGSAERHLRERRGLVDARAHAAAALADRQGLYALSALSALAITFDSMGWFAVFGALGFFAWPLFILSYILSLTQTTFAGGLEVSRSELVVHARPSATYPASRISGALVVEREMFGGFVPTVEIELTNGDILTARLPDPRSAHAVVRALGFGAGGRRVHASLAKPTRRLLIRCSVSSPTCGMTVMLGPPRRAPDSGFEFGYALYPLVALVIYAGPSGSLRAPEITVGDDGVLVKRRFGRLFVPRGDIAFVTAAGPRWSSSAGAASASL